MITPRERTRFTARDTPLAFGMSALLWSCLLTYNDWPERRAVAAAGTMDGAGRSALAAAGTMDGAGRSALAAAGTMDRAGRSALAAAGITVSGSSGSGGASTAGTKASISGPINAAGAPNRLGTGGAGGGSLTLSGGASSSAAITSARPPSQGGFSASEPWAAGGFVAAGGVSLGSGGSGATTSNPQTLSTAGTNENGGTAVGGSPTSGGSTAAPGAGGATLTIAGGKSWLTLSGNRARAADAPNGLLGIDGLFYVYSDGCATVNFEPDTRCVTGKLCDAGYEYENWGVALGFDFRNTGDAGSPRNAKLTWDPRSVGAIGVTWSISGSSIAQLELWVLDMDPSFGGVCTASSCEIAGPPDGSAKIAASGELHFDSMFKDDWGGAGTPYAYDPALTQSLQFKIAAVKVGAAPYRFCIDQLGLIIR